MSWQGRSIAGPVLIVLGLLMILGQFGLEGIGLFWIIMLLVAGLAALAAYSQGRRHPAVLAAGVWLSLLALHLLTVKIGWVSLSKSAPFFVMAPGLALLAVAAADRTNKDALTPAGALIGISLLGFAWTLGIISFLLRLIFRVIEVVLRYVLPLALMVWGGWMVFGRRQTSDATPPEYGFVPGPDPDVPEKIEPLGSAPVVDPGVDEVDVEEIAEADQFEELEELADTEKDRVTPPDDAVIEEITDDPEEDARKTD